MDKTGEWLPKETLEAIRESLVAIKDRLRRQVVVFNFLNVAYVKNLISTLVLDLFVTLKEQQVHLKNQKNKYYYLPWNTEIFMGIEWSRNGRCQARDWVQTETNVTNSLQNQVVSESVSISIEGSKRLIRSAIDHAQERSKESDIIHKRDIQKSQKVASVNGGYEELRRL